MNRVTGRVIPIDSSSRALLLYGHEPNRPDQPFWFTIGGGIEGDETVRQAAAREMFEEVSVRIDETDLGTPIIIETVEFDWGDTHIVQEQHIFTCRLDADTPLSLDGLEEGEIGTVERAAWVTLDELDAGSGACPVEGADLPRYVRICLATLTQQQD